MRRFARATLALAAAALLGSPAPATAAPLPVTDAALIAKAKAEGTVVLYGSMVATELAEVARRFHAAYGIKVQSLRMESNVLPARVLTEERGGVDAVDLIDEPGFQTDELRRQGLLASYAPPEDAALLKGTFDPAGSWATVFLNTETIAYNPARLKAMHLAPPRTWEDLAAAPWHGQFGLFTGSYEWYAALEHYYGEQRGDELMRAYVANDVRMLNSHQLGITLVESGDLAAAANTYGYGALMDRDKGAPVDFVNPNPTIIEIHAVAILKTAPHPYAARLFERWWLSRPTQQWIVTTLHRISPRKDVKNDPALLGPKVHYVISNPAESANYNQDVRAFEALFRIPG